VTPNFPAPDPATPVAALMDLSGDAAVVTGGGHGIGEAICRRLAQSGADLVVVDSDQSNARRVARDLTTGPRRAIAVDGDVRDPETATRAVAGAMDQLGRLDILVNCAGIYPSTPVLDLTEQQWDDVIDVNLKGSFLFSQAAGRVMAASGGGVIVNMASRAGLRARPGVVAYSAAKAGVVVLTQGLAMELAEDGIRVNAVAPGPVATEQSAAAAAAKVAGTGKAPEQWQEDYRSRIPLRRFAEADEIALAVLFLASPASSFITGTVITVDGGAMLP
jgi:2-deoxy-D-gluconate 3-dehydrogenase